MIFKILTSFRFVPKENPFRNSVPCQRTSEVCKKIATEPKGTKEWFDRAALWNVYVYLISSTSMQKKNSVANSVRQIKICCTKYKFTERSHNFLFQSLLCSWSLVTFEIFTSIRFVPKENPFRNSVPCQRTSETCQKLQQSKKYHKMVWPSRPLESICLFY